MATIRDIAQEAITYRFLSLDAENQLRQLLATTCQPEDLRAFCRLQAEIMEGRVTQEAREKWVQQQQEAAFAL
ncbi:hypothetical protein PN462_13930 [Spirulina sp. CS-785/01]|uniref:hypothetical protein n=1 Tax=Spirulina sp. CS-785/01 TaxID=3021716 RepID=UPI00232BFAE7|nr:hypothetical protein [Spirulina sp. CS-785/01]MDB9314207.1 hypothetical protein [Spirulina sp. CS-785/01]